MSAQREWKPGDVAVRTNFDRELVTFFVECISSDHAEAGRQHWHHANGGFDPIGGKPTYRPLVVIDPEDVEQVRELVQRSSFYAPGEVITPLVQALQKGLRLAARSNPQEPTAPSAVIEDTDGHRWVSWRCGPGVHERPWQRLEMDVDEFRDYRDINVSRVLYEGVTS